MNESKFDCNRRDFLKVAGIGVAALTVSSMGMTTNSEAASMSKPKLEEYTADVLVIGGGMAGAFAAMNAKEEGAKVILVEKGSVCKSGCTPFARGFSYWDEKTNPRTKEEILDECSLLGEYILNRAYARLALDNSTALYEEIKDWGMFGIQKFGGIIAEKVLDKGIKVIEKTMMTSLIMDGERVAGAVGFPLDEDEKAVIINASAVIICTGGSSFKPNGYPINSLTADGDAMAYRIGAEIGGKEFNDTHWTFFENPASCYDNWKEDWERGLNKAPQCGPVGGLDIRFELTAHAGKAPILQANQPRPVKGLPPGFGGQGRPAGRDPVAGGVSSPGGRPPGGRPLNAPGMRGHEPDNPIVGGGASGKSVHKAEGLFPQDDKCSSNIPGLYAAGDSLSSMHNGADYASGTSSLCTSGIQGKIAGKAAAKYASSIKKPSVSKKDIEALINEMLAPRERDKGFTPGWVTQILQNTMIPYFVLFVKKKERMEAALSTVEFIRDHFVPLLTARDTHELRLAHETGNMVLNAEMKLRAGLFRTESRGSHFREDYPARDDANWLAYVKLKKDDRGDMDYRISYEERYPLRYPGELEYLEQNSRLRNGK
jgi:succinate dehydrogenase/fumarate reductase flavoprotein subunit